MARDNGRKPEERAHENDPQDISAELQALREDVAALAASLHRAGASGVAGLKRRSEDLAEDSLDEALRNLRDLRQQVHAMQGKLEGEMHAHPLAWLAGALGLGLLAGLLLSRRD